MSSSKPSPARRIATALLPITALSLAACGSLPFSSSSPSSSAPATTAAASPSATPSATASASASASASATASATDTASATASGDPSGTNGLTPENTKGRELRLSDFQQPSSASSWNEKQYDVASSTGVMGIGTDLDWQHNGEIELRLANKFQKVTFNAGQANDSKSSDLTVKVQIFADGKEIDTVNVPFNDAHAFDVDVANVNALKITLTPLDRMQLMPSMGLHTTGVIFNVKAE